MSDKYRLPHCAAHAMRGESSPNMGKVAEGVMDVTKIAVIGSVGMGLAGAAGAALKK